MKKAFAIFTAVILMPAGQSMAWTGGPWSNNAALPSGDDGVYEAVATMSNGVGLFRFAVRNNGVSSEAFGGGGQTSSTTASSNVQFNAGLLGAQSSNIWYYKGITYYGSCYGIANSDAGIVSAVGNGSSSAGVNFVVTPGSVTVPGQVIILPSVNNAIISGSSGGNVGFANSSFIAKMKNKGPTVRFSGKGEISFTGSMDTLSTIEAVNPAVADNTTGIVPTAINGVTPGNSGTDTNTTTTTKNVVTNTVIPVDGGTVTTNSTTNTTGTTNGGSVETTFNSFTNLGTGGEDSDFSQRGHVRKFIVFGSRVSTSVSP